MDSSGIAWLKITSPDGRILNPTFYFYDFNNQTIYEARFTNLNLYRFPDETRRGDRIILRDGMIYFTAMDLNAPVQWPYVYSVDMRRQVPTGITRAPERVPVSFDLKPNYPNPFRDQTTLRMVLPQASPVEIRVYDILGRLVYSRHMKRLGPGEHHIALKAQNWGSGMYFYRIKVGGAMKSGKMLIVR
ncbi:MAG: T9SS type A sorting domain-containing protein [candidate division KSB1 bacterium]|nr:T9SS type A sorting domain-containing protein [candidate division KSB1 bacterium]